MYPKWALHWVVVDIDPKTSFAALNRRRREKTSEGKWAIDWAAECITYQRLSWERSFSHLLAFTRRSNSRVRGSAVGEPGVGEGGTWVNFCWVCDAGVWEPLPPYSLPYTWPHYKPYLRQFGKNAIFVIPTLVTFCSCIYLIKPFNLVILRWPDTFVKLQML